MHTEYNIHKANDSRIHLSDSWEVNHLCEELNLRTEELKEIIKRVGADINSIRNFVGLRLLKNESPY